MEAPNALVFEDIEDLPVTVAPAGAANTVAGLPAVRIIIMIIAKRPPSV